MSGAGEDQRLAEVLEERARRLAETARSSEARVRLYEVALVRIGSQHLGVPADHVRDIAPLTTLTRLPAQPRLVRGLTQLRGQLMSVIDGAALVEASDAGSQGFAVVLDAEQGPIALAVDSVEGFRPVFADEVVDGLNATTRPVIAATRDLVSILDVPRILESEGVVAR